MDRNISLSKQEIELLKIALDCRINKMKELEKKIPHMRERRKEYEALLERIKG